VSNPDSILTESKLTPVVFEIVSTCLDQHKIGHVSGGRSSETGHAILVRVVYSNSDTEILHTSYLETRFKVLVTRSIPDSLSEGWVEYNYRHLHSRHLDVRQDRYLYHTTQSQVDLSLISQDNPDPDISVMPLIYPHSFRISPGFSSRWLATPHARNPPRDGFASTTLGPQPRGGLPSPEPKRRPFAQCSRKAITERSRFIHIMDLLTRRYSR
jgi:hypothetical protein